MRVVHRQRPHEDPVDDAEHRGVGADGESQRADGGDRQRTAAAQEADARKAPAPIN
jgi:hypothetical protein